MSILLQKFALNPYVICLKLIQLLSIQFFQLKKLAIQTHLYSVGGVGVGVVSVEKKSEWLPKSKSDDQHKSMTIP